AEVAPGTVSLADSRAEIRRGESPLVEWYQNDANGLEQGFSLAERPGGEPSDSSLVLELATGGVLRPVLRQDESRVVFIDGTGAGRLTYSQLVAWDAAGKALHATLSVANDRVQIQVSDAGATYPITIDPVIQPASWIVESNVASALFGA